MSHPIRAFPSFSPWLKLAAWVGLMVTLGTLVQGLRWLCGQATPLWPGPATCKFFAVAGFWILLRLDNRSLPDYGLVAGPIWRRQLFGAFAAGAGLLLILFLAAGGLGAWTWTLVPSAAALERAVLRAGRLRICLLA